MIQLMLSGRTNTNQMKLGDTDENNTAHEDEDEVPF